MGIISVAGLILSLHGGGGGGGGGAHAPPVSPTSTPKSLQTVQFGIILQLLLLYIHCVLICN